MARTVKIGSRKDHPTNVRLPTALRAMVDRRAERDGVNRGEKIRELIRVGLVAEDDPEFVDRLRAQANTTAQLLDHEPFPNESDDQ